MTLTHKLALSSAILAAFAADLTSQRSYDQEKMTAQYEEMLTHDWYTGSAWTTDFAEAKAKAAESGKPILAYFTRTYAA